MKKILTILIFGISISIAACKHSDKKVTEMNSPVTQQAVDLNKMLKDSANFTTMQWPDSTFQDLGKVEEGQVVEVAYRFKNTGDKPLVIVSVSAGCGCITISKKPQEAIPPGQEGFIKVKYNSKNMPGVCRKDVNVIANTKVNTSHILSFRVEVIKK
jgi:hypothetical protein